MQVSVKVNLDLEWVLDESLFDNEEAIAQRVQSLSAECRHAVNKVLRYLYLTAGPGNLSRDALLSGVHHLSTAERKVVRWLYTRTNGSLRHKYGAGVLIAARRSRCRCEECGMPDVRVLNFDHVEGCKADDPTFNCMCANCHHIKSCKEDWYSSRPTETAEKTDGQAAVS